MFSIFYPIVGIIDAPQPQIYTYITFSLPIALFYFIHSSPSSLANEEVIQRFIKRITDRYLGRQLNWFHKNSIKIRGNFYHYAFGINTYFCYLSYKHKRKHKQYNCQYFLMINRLSIRLLCALRIYYSKRIQSIST